MFLTELFTKTQLDELDPGFVNDTIVRQRQPFKHQQAWERKGKGATASVWQHFSDPTTVVKVVGGGDHEAFGDERNCTLAFVHFLVDHGHKSKHLPIVHGINIDDDEVLQIRMEKLVELPVSLASLSSRLASYVCSSYDVNPKDISNILKELQREINRSNYKNNSAKDILAAIQLLHRAIPVYTGAHNLKKMWLDLHAGNWLARPNGTIIAADPWYSDSEYNDCASTSASDYWEDKRSFSNGSTDRNSSPAIAWKGMPATARNW